MTISLKHKKTSPVPTSGDNSLVQGPDWNDEHNLSQATAGLLGRPTSGGVDVVPLNADGTLLFHGDGSLGVDISKIAGTGTVMLVGPAASDSTLVFSPVGGVTTSGTIRVNTATIAPLASPIFTGDPKAPTPATADNDTSIATTAYVQANIAALPAPPTTLPPSGAAGGALAGTYPNPTLVGGPLTLYAPLASPTFTGDPKAPTPTAGDSDTSIATTAFVSAALTTSLANYLPLAGGTLTGTLNGTNINASVGMASPIVTSTATLVLNAATGSTISQRINNAPTVTTQNNAMFPATTNTIALGASTNRWSTVASVLGDFSGDIVAGGTATIKNTTAPPAGGTSGIFMGNSTLGVNFGSGAPTLSAGRGSLYLRNDGGGPYVNTDGATTWTAVGGGGASISIGDTPPGSPVAGAMWWNSTTGTLFIYYNDGNTSQWVPATPAAAAPSGTVVQVVSFETGAVATGTTIVPVDDTIPQITEGDQYMTLSITPKSATSKLVIEVTWNGANLAGTRNVVALFQDSTANALAVSEGIAAANVVVNVRFVHTMTSGTTSATTFRVRAGPAAASTVTFNGAGAARLYGGVMASSIVITETL